MTSLGSRPGPGLLARTIVEGLVREAIRSAAPTRAAQRVAGLSRTLGPDFHRLLTGAERSRFTVSGRRASAHVAAYSQR
jgi:hypothetical protein